MKSIKFTAAILAAFTLCLSAGCSESGSDGAKPQDTAPAAQSAEAPEVPEAETWAQTFIPSKAEQLDITKLPPFELSSDDLHNGVWDTDITNTKNGSNRSPQLSWQAVDGAACYAVYMIDTGTDGYSSWMHWKSLTEDTSLPAGRAARDEYIGPYPPEGTHVYEILVFAMKQAPEKLKGSFNTSNPKLLEAFRVMDGTDGGNIIACGHIKGTYTYGD